MGFIFKVFKKTSPNGKITIYLAKRDFVDHVSTVEPIDGVVLLHDDYINENRKVFGQVICCFRYGREEDEMMGLQFQKELFLASEQIFPQPEKADRPLTKLQERLLKKLGPNAFPFTFQLPKAAPNTITLQQGPDDEGAPCGVSYFVRLFSGQNDIDRAHRRSAVSLGIRKIQYAPIKLGKQPTSLVRKSFLLSPGELELEATLDKQVYHHGEQIAVNISIHNHSNKFVKKIKVSIQQGVDVLLFQNGQYRTTISQLETEEGCPVAPGSNLQKVIYLSPTLDSNKNRRGIAIDGALKGDTGRLASTTLLTEDDLKDSFGIVINYILKVKLYLGALGGELAAELPMVLMNPKPVITSQKSLIHADSQADVETFRQDTIDELAG